MKKVTILNLFEFFFNRFSEDEIDEMLQDCPVDKKGNIDYITYTQILKRGKKDEDEDALPPK